VLTRRRILQSAGAAGLTALLSPVTTPVYAAVASSAGLAARARAAGILYGCAASTYQLTDRPFVAALTREARILVPEYELKRDKVEASRGQLDLSKNDALLRFAKANGMAMRGHTLVWHRANPPWLEDALVLSRDDRLITDYATKVMSHFRGRLHSFDVVNESLDAKSPRKDGLRESLWLKAFGPHYIDLAFHAARAADPDAMLVYNDWGCEAGANDRMRAITLDFLGAALARNVPIDAYGMQGHLAAFGPKVDQRKLRDFLAQLSAMGLRILVTEHDVYDTDGPTDIAERDRAVADASRRFLDVVLDNPAVHTVLTWGLTDKYLDPPDNWRDRLRGYQPRLLPLDSALTRKPLWNAMADTFDRYAATRARRP